MKTKFFSVVLSILAGVPAFAEYTVDCHQGEARRVGYVEVSISSAKPIEQSEEVGTEVAVEVKQIVKLGRKSKTTITTKLQGEVIPDTRPMPRPDPATLIQLSGEDEMDQPTQYGMLIVRTRLSDADTMQLSAVDGSGFTVSCE